MAGSENSEVGFEGGLPWLPSQVLDEAVACHNQKKDHVKHQYHRSRPKTSPVEFLPLNSKSSIRPHHRPRYPAWVSGGSGMQALFLDSGKRSCGTGVFLPHMTGSNFQSTKKPACSPVLLPSRVVQALNLNVNALGLQVSPRKDHRNNSKDGDCISVKNKNGSKDVQTKCCVNVSQNQSSSPEIFLPKEWTY